MSVLNAVAEFERDLLIERTQAGMARARAEGKVLGRPSALLQQAEAMQRLATGESVAKVARDYRTTRQSIMRVREGFADPVQPTPDNGRRLLDAGQAPKDLASGVGGVRGHHVSSFRQGSVRRDLRPPTFDHEIC